MCALPSKRSSLSFSRGYCQIKSLGHIIRSESIGIHDTVRINAPLNNGRQRCGACVGIYGRANFAITLQQTGTCCFPGGSTSTFSYSDSSKATLISFYLTGQPITGERGTIRWRKRMKQDAAVLRFTPAISPAALAVAPATKNVMSSVCCRLFSLPRLSYMSLSRLFFLSQDSP